MASTRLKLLTFDVTNTILRVKDSPGHQYSEVGKMFGIAVSPTAINKVYGTTWQQKKQDHPNYGVDHGMTTKDWWHDFVKRVFVKAGYQGNHDELKKVSDSLWNRFQDGLSWEVIPNSREILSVLKNAGIKLGIVSNFDERLEKIIAAHKMDHYFDFLVTSHNTGLEKPNPSIFQHALSISGFTPDVVGHVGDDVSHDYKTPKDMGMSAFLFSEKSLDSTKAPESAGQSLTDVNQGEIITDLMDLKQIVMQSSVN
jgi:REG-2-like HAD superfamily hydrolase